MEDWLVGSWQSIVRTVAAALCAYPALIVILRVSGKRTLAKMNAFDLVVTVSLGSALASIVVSPTVSLAQGVAALALLVGLQFAITWSSVRVPWVRHWVTGEPAVLLYEGAVVPSALRRTRVTAEEVRAAIRSAGIADLRDVTAVVLETDGSFSVVPRVVSGSASSLRGLCLPAPEESAACEAHDSTCGCKTCVAGPTDAPRPEVAEGTPLAASPGGGGIRPPRRERSVK